MLSEKLENIHNHTNPKNKKNYKRQVNIGSLIYITLLYYQYFKKYWN